LDQKDDLYVINNLGGSFPQSEEESSLNDEIFCDTSVDSDVEDIHVCKGHEARVNKVVFSPDGRQALTGSDDMTLRLWDIRDGREIRVFEGHSGAIKCVDFSPDGLSALSGAEDMTLRLWDLKNGSEVKRLEGHEDEVSHVAFSSDGLFALSGSYDRTFRLWDLKEGCEACQVQEEGLVLASAYSNVRNEILYACREGRWVASLLEEFCEDVISIYHLDLESNEIYLWDSKTDYKDLVFSPDGSIALVWDGESSAVGLWDLESRSIKTITENDEDMILSATALSPDNRYALLAFIDANGTEIDTSTSADGAILVYDIGNVSVRRKFDGLTGRVNSLAFSPDARSALSGSVDGTLRLWGLPL
jgi:WD40 repeat protein